MELINQISGVLALLAVAISIGSSVFAWVTTGSKRNHKKIENLETRATTHAERLQTIESELKHLPDTDTAHRLELALERLHGRIETLDERLKPVAAISERMQEILVEQAKK